MMSTAETAGASAALTLLALPIEMLAVIAGFLGDTDFGRFRQTCSRAAEVTPVARALRLCELPVGWPAVAEAVREAARRGFTKVLAVFRDRFGYATIAPATFFLKLADAAGAGRRDLVKFVAASTAVAPAQAVEAVQVAAACAHFGVLEELRECAGPEVFRACWRGACVYAHGQWPEMVAFLADVCGFDTADWAGPDAGRHAAVEVAAETNAAALLAALAARGALAVSPAALAAGLKTAAARGHRETVAALLALWPGRAVAAAAAVAEDTLAAAVAAAAVAAAVASHGSVLEELARAAPVMFAQVEPSFEAAVALPAPEVLRFFAAREPARALFGAGCWLLRLAASSRRLDVLELLWPAVAADTAAVALLLSDACARAETREFSALCRQLAKCAPLDNFSYADSSADRFLTATSPARGRSPNDDAHGHRGRSPNDHAHGPHGRSSKNTRTFFANFTRA